VNIRNRIFFSYVVLVLFSLFFLSSYVYLTTLRGTIDRDLTRLYEVKNSWGDMLIAMNNIVENWDDGRSFSTFTHRVEQVQTGLDYLNSDGVRRFYYPKDLKEHVAALYRIWHMAQGNIKQIEDGIDTADFQRIVQTITHEPGLQRLNNLWVELFYRGTSQQRTAAYTIRQVLDSIEFFPIFSSTMNRQFNIILDETSAVRESVVRIQVALAVSFFAIFLMGYFTFSFLFARSISRPIVDVSLKLKRFIGQSIEPTSIVHSDEIALLDHSVTTLIEHYTYLSQRALTLAQGDIESESPGIPSAGIVGNALGEISEYLRRLAQVSSWIRDGRYGAEVEVVSHKDVLGQTFNIMSREIRERITTLSRVFDAIEEALLVIHENGSIVESNNRLLKLLGVESIGELNRCGGLPEFVVEYDRFLGKVLKEQRNRSFFATMITARGVHIPVRIAARRLEPVTDQQDHIMLFISNESWKVRMKRERARLKSQAVLAELRALRAQINPHFLFNTLNTIAQLAETSPDRAVNTIEKLAGLFRYALSTTERDTVTVSEELGHLRDFLEIEQLRFEDSLSITFQIDSSIESLSMPPMLLQPIVENALRHGGDEAGRVEILIRAELRENEVVFGVEDHGTLSAGSDFFGSRGIGLKNVENRLRTYYGKSIVIRPNNPAGTIVTLSIPAGAWQ